MKADTIATLARQHRLNPKTVYRRLAIGWELEEALNTTVGQRRPPKERQRASEAPETAPPPVDPKKLSITQIYELLEEKNMHFKLFLHRIDNDMTFLEALNAPVEDHEPYAKYTRRKEKQNMLKKIA